MTPRRIALAYFAVLLVFAGIYYAMPDTDFYHQSIQFEPSSVEHLRRFQAGLDEALGIQQFGKGPYGVTVSPGSVHDLSFPFTNYVRFTMGYYYYNQQASESDWALLTSHCGPSEKLQPFYLRNIGYRMNTFASSGGHSVTIRAETPQLTECDIGVLKMLYTSIERTPEGFQAMAPVSPELNDLLQAVSREQLGHAPRAFQLDRFSRMFYFSVAAMTTTGFGDILPLTTTARLLASAETLCGIVLAGVFLNTIAKSS